VLQLLLTSDPDIIQDSPNEAENTDRE